MKNMLIVFALFATLTFCNDDVPFNVLVLNPDDMRPSLGCYGLDEVHSPNIDALASKGVRFVNAFVNEPVCNPSRSSFMTSRRPQKTKVWNFINHIRQTPEGQTWKTVAQHFKENGYFTAAGGKSFHDNVPPNYDGATSWSIEDYPYMPTVKTLCFDSDSLLWSTVPNASVNPTALCPMDKPDDWFFDHKLATHIIGAMDKSIELGKPFFLWAGFFKPHHPFVVPKRVYDRYTVGDLSLPKNKILDVPLDFSDAALFNYNQGPQAHPPFTDGNRTLDYGPHTPFPDEWIRLMRAGYYSAITWTDEQIGRIMDALEARGLADNTIVVLFSDNGIAMGENSAYMKTDTWDISTRVPLIFYGPRTPNGKVRKTPVELIDIFPTLSSLANLPTPSGLDGKDLTKLIRSQNEQQYAGYAAFSETPRCGDITQPEPWKVLERLLQWNCMGTPRPRFTFMGYTVRTLEWRYTEWRYWNAATLSGVWTPEGLVGAELYDHRNDQLHGSSFFDDNEDENLVDIYQGAPFLEDLKELLHSNWN